MQSKLVSSSLELISPVTFISCFDDSLSLSLPPSSLPFPSLSNFMFTHQ